ncbi:sigma-54-dependent transcriptional regulator [Thiocapsa rosea]|uniref:sigma-54-dependent transcriptional regulator n=1 Tax=Thiocapsa rosea TaxID=69360 RepID=UPI001FE990E5|nr:sigma 54-interacting transcriptional regulator [Thiocapsa rosea]
MQLECYGDPGGIRVREYQAALSAVGIGLAPAAGALRTEAAAPGHGILLFDEPDAAVLNHVRQSSGGGRRRVVAVALRRAPRPPEVWRLLAAGAADVLAWDAGPDCAARIHARLERWAAVDESLASAAVRAALVGTSDVWQQTLRALIETARFTQAPVLLLGESGTGKEEAARLIHTLDPRTAKPELQVLDCTTIVPDLAGSELFGHERGAFTGAVAQREGAFALANGGTLLLDEVGELPLPLQAQLLRVIQEGSYKRVGGNTWQQTRFRLLCATNRDLTALVRAGAFRADLYHRIASQVHRLPPLRERREDILPLAEHFLRLLRPDDPPPELDAATRAWFLCHDYPGNARELRQRVTRLLLRHPGGDLITVGSIPSEERPTADDAGGSEWPAANLEPLVRSALAAGIGLKALIRAVDDLAEQVAVTDADNNLQRAAQVLGITDRALQERRAKRRQEAAT